MPRNMSVGGGGRVCTRLLLGIGLCLVAVSVLTLTFHQLLYQTLVDPSLVLSRSSPGYKIWLTTDVPVYLHFYLWNITNSEQVLARTHPPQLQEVGPFVYREKHFKVNLTWHANGTVTYMQVKRWFFRPDLSKGNLSDMITTLNVPLVAAATFIKGMGLAAKAAFNILLSSLGTQVFVRHNVSDLLFDGYDDPLLKMASLAEKISNFSVPFDRFGWFYSRNNSRYYDGVFTMDTGAGRDGIGELGRLRFWNGSSVTRAFSPPCNMINGTTGELFRPRLDHGPVQIYSPDICRSLSVPFAERLIFDGLMSHRYEANELMFATPDINPDNQCFCDGECPPSGLLNETRCRFGVPAFISFPHMLYVDEHVLNQTRGQRPDVAHHNFSLNIEPASGVPLSVRARFQVNMLLRPNLDIYLLSKLPELYLPLVWFENRVDVDSQVTAQLQLVASTLPKLLSAGSCVLLALGVSLLALGALLMYRRTGRSTTADVCGLASGDSRSSSAASVVKVARIDTDDALSNDVQQQLDDDEGDADDESRKPHTDHSNNDRLVSKC